MSFSGYAEIIREAKLTAAEKLILYTLQGLHTAGVTKMKLKDLTSCMSMSYKTVSKGLGSLEKEGWLCVNKDTTPRSYTLNKPKFTYVEEHQDLRVIVKSLLEGRYMKYPKNTKFQEVVATLNNVKPKKVDTVPALVNLWKTVVPLVFDEVTMVPQFTQAQLGQMKHYLKKVKPQADPYHTLEVILENWADFTAHVRSRAGIEHTPTLPNVGFVLKYCEFAVNFTSKFDSASTGSDDVLAEFTFS